ncbi:MAG TPA: C4-type zinc ribbon domain-containing protein [Candidatus Acidoferrales bacterium]|nr:C4-type zinc ribbon domain-containing protein [Candidatus Acidoferrales bacterium]
MQKSLQSLLDLQAIDLRLNQVRTRLAAFPQKFATADARVAAARAELDQAKAAQVATVRDRKKYELDVEQWKDRVRKYRDQTSQVKTNEAYKALQHEVDLAEAEIAKAEDRLLEQMVNAEDYDRRVKISERRLKQIEEDVSGERAALDAERASAERDLAALNAQRVTIVTDIPENLLDHYARIAKKHGGIALAELRDERCSACGMRVRPHVFQEMQRGADDKMFHCETCTRIMYYVGNDSSASSAPPASQASA